MLSEEENLKNVMNTSIEKLTRGDLSDVERADESFWFFGTYAEMIEKGLPIPFEAVLLNCRETAKWAVQFNVFHLYDELDKLMHAHERPGPDENPYKQIWWCLFHAPYYDTLEELFDPIREWLSIAGWISRHYAFGDEYIADGVDYMIDELIMIRNQVEYCIDLRDGKIDFPDDDSESPPDCGDDDDDDDDDGPSKDLFDPSGVRESSELVLV